MKQSIVLSPILFTAFMDFCSRLVQRGIGSEIFGNADDLVLIAETAK